MQVSCYTHNHTTLQHAQAILVELKKLKKPFQLLNGDQKVYSKIGTNTLSGCIERL